MFKKPKYKITNHALQQYAKRINFSQKKITDAILKDLHALKGKRIITVGQKEYVFYKNSREFVIQNQKDQTKVVLTVIKHKRDRKEDAIKKRLKEKEEYEKNNGWQFDSLML